MYQQKSFDQLESWKNQKVDYKVSWTPNSKNKKILMLLKQKCKLKSAYKQENMKDFKMLGQQYYNYFQTQQVSSKFSGFFKISQKKIMTQRSLTPNVRYDSHKQKETTNYINKLPNYLRDSFKLNDWVSLKQLKEKKIIFQIEKQINK